ncbi:MAG: GYD domain-containing protein [Planctomycetes bacterium]|nr:GYD domain-containing protein [Planctomycetota bacterium]
MPYYLTQVAYTSEAWATQLKNPVNRTEAIKPAVEKLGGKVESVYYAFGEYDIVAVFQFPENVSASAFSLAVAAGGAIKAIKTTPLMTVEEGIAAMKKAASAGYRPPGR